MAQLFADENFPHPVVEMLRRSGHVVVTAHEKGLAGQATPDESILQAAGPEESAVLTLNRRHFIRIHGAMPDHAGIIVCTADPDERALARRIDTRIREEGTLHRKLIRINRPER